MQGGLPSFLELLSFETNWVEHTAAAAAAQAIHDLLLTATLAL